MTDKMNSKVSILWTNADPSAAYHMVFMYAGNSMRNRWWDDVTVIIWGPAQKLTAEDEGIQEHIRELQKLGVKFSACLTCAVELDVREQLERLGIEVIRWGSRLTDMIKAGEHIIYV